MITSFRIYPDVDYTYQIEIVDCTASTAFDAFHKCENVYLENAVESYWRSLHHDNWPWIEVVLRDEYFVKKLKILQTNIDNYWFKDTIIEFSDGSQFNHTLNNQSGWITVKLPDTIRSHFVKLIQKTGWGSYTGISKIQAFGYRTGNLAGVNKVQNSRRDISFEVNCYDIYIFQNV